jgi:alpha-acetolactate decarboxylase
MNSKLSLILIALVAVVSSITYAAGLGQFGVTAYGNFKRLSHTGDASGNVVLVSVPASPGVYGVGALADLRGEILIWDGKVFVTRGESITGSVEPPGPQDQAALLVTGRVKGWHQAAAPHDMAQREFERFVIDTARKIGIDISKPFPFVARGEVTNYLWHVVTGSSKQHGGASQQQQGHANNRTFSGAKTVGVLVGFYSAEELEGVISHPGERFHIHYADNDIKISGHLDQFGVGKGFALLLPKQ